MEFLLAYDFIIKLIRDKNGRAIARRRLLVRSILAAMRFFCCSSALRKNTTQCCQSECFAAGLRLNAQRHRGRRHRKKEETQMNADGRR